MRLVKYKVNKFRSVKGTEWIDIDQWACFVGVNESGKTNLLLPLWKFNPADKTTKIDLLLDYPRDEFSELDNKTNNRENEHFIEVLFEITNEERDTFTKAYQEKTAQEASAKTEGEQVEVVIEPINFTKYLLMKKNYKELFYIYISDENCNALTDDIEDIVGDEIFTKICDYIPKFVYYSEYGNLDSDLYLPHVKENLSRLEQLTGKERMKARTLKILFSHLRLNPDEILQLGQESINNTGIKTPEQITQESRNKQERYAKLDSAASRLTKQFQDWWSQGNYIFNFNADGLYFRIFVSDSQRPEKIELESRSKGLQWFFSFFLVFLAESEDNHKNCILLLDEPGLSLHPNAQTDLIRFFNQISEKNQLIYTTHLPFLVDHNNLDKVKAVYTDKGLTKASNDISKADKEKKAIQPVNAAIGITASQSLLVGCDIIIVEGISDQHYLTMIKNHLVAKGKFKPTKEMVFIPVGGARGVKPVVSIIYGSHSNLPYTILDSDETGKEFKKNLLNGLYKGDKEKVLETDTYTGLKGSEIEDLIPIELLVESYDRLFRPEINLTVSDLNINEPLISQFEKFATEQGIQLDLGWKVDLSKRIKQKFTSSNVVEELEEKWLTMFRDLQSQPTEKTK